MTTTSEFLRSSFIGDSLDRFLWALASGRWERTRLPSDRFARYMRSLFYVSKLLQSVITLLENRTCLVRQSNEFKNGLIVDLEK